MPNRTSFASIGLTYLENAILDAFGERSYLPWQLARIIGLYPDIMVGNMRAGSQIVRAILESLEREGRVKRASFRDKEWELTESERRLRL